DDDEDRPVARRDAGSGHDPVTRPLPVIAAEPEPAGAAAAMETLATELPPEPTEIDASVPCDLRWLASCCGDEPEEMVVIAQMFTERASELLEEMKAAAAAGDEDALRRAAHSLRGNSGAVGAGPMLQRLAPSAGDVRYDVAAVEAAFVQAREHLRRSLELPTS